MLELCPSSINSTLLNEEEVLWFEVHEDGTLATDPFNFVDPPNRPITVRAIWRRMGVYTLKFPLAAPPSAVKVNGVDCTWEYDAEDMAVVVKTPPQDGTHETVVELAYGGTSVPASRNIAALSGIKGEYRRVAALTEEFRKALAGYGPGSKRRGALPEYVANLPDTWQVVWKTRDIVAEHPSDAQKLLAEYADALTVFAEKD